MLKRKVFVVDLSINVKADSATQAEKIVRERFKKQFSKYKSLRVGYISEDSK